MIQIASFRIRILGFPFLSPIENIKGRRPRITREVSLYAANCGRTQCSDTRPLRLGLLITAVAPLDLNLFGVNELVVLNRSARLGKDS